MSFVFLFAGACSEDRPAEKTVSESKGDPLQEGEAIFVKNCQVCHGIGGKGDIGPDLTDAEWKFGSTDEQLFHSIAKGRSGGMPKWENSLGEEKIRKVISYLRSINAN
jgi:cytochrome c oxidase cbb3-type subunit 3